MATLLLFLSVLGCFLGVFSKTCDVTDYGAVADGKTDNVKAIQSAIEDCTESKPSNPLNMVKLSQSDDNVRQCHLTLSAI